MEGLFGVTVDQGLLFSKHAIELVQSGGPGDNSRPYWYLRPDDLESFDCCVLSGPFSKHGLNSFRFIFFVLLVI